MAQAKPVPTANPVRFAAWAGPQPALYWPIVTNDPNALVVSSDLVGGGQQGRPGRRFLADRSGGKRYHVGIDLFAADGDDVLACADGVIVNYYPFYKTSVGEMSWALFVAHDGFVANYGEVKANAPQVFGWKIGDKVGAGQPIARVSSTSMIHFETFVPGTKVNTRWMKNGPRPASLLNPSQLLLDLAAGGVRVPLGGPVAAAPVAAAPTAPQPTHGGWHSMFGGQQWRFDHRGVYLRAAPDTPLRTPGAPLTCRRIYELYGTWILQAADRHGVNPALIMMTIATETGFAKADDFTGPRTFRWEAHVNNADVTPAFKGAYSAGPMQGLSTTVREMLVNHGAAWGLPYAPFTVAPALTAKPVPSPASHPLYEPKANIEIGTAEIRLRWSKTADDPILVAAAFNAGGLYPKVGSAWGLRAHGDHLDRAARWYGDSCAALTEAGVF